MLAGCASFSVMSVLAHAAGQRCNWQTVAFFRGFLVLLFVGIFSLATGTKLVFLRPRKLWVRSIAGSLSLVMCFYALSKLKASTVVTLSNTFPIGLLLGVGLTASIGQMFLTRAFAHGDPARVSVVGLAQVVFTLAIDVVFTDHRVTTDAMIGTLLILAPTAWVMLGRRRQRTSVP